MEMTSGLKYDDEAARARQPKPEDEPEKVIVQKLRDGMLSTPWSQHAFADAKPILVSYFKESIERKDDKEFVKSRTQQVLFDLSQVLGSKIEEGEENLDSLRGKSVFLATNHLGTYKLLGLDPKNDLNHPEIDLPVLHPFPAFYASMYPVASRLEDELLEAAHDYPEPIRDVQVAAGSLIMPPGQTGTLDELEKETKNMFEANGDVALTLFPEGGTTGKRNNGGIYDMEKFKTGSFVIAGHLGIPVLPVAQYFDPNEGFKLKVFSPIRLSPPSDETEARSYFRNVADSASSEMQAWLTQKSSTSNSFHQPQ